MYVRARINMSNCKIYHFSQVLHICFKIIFPVKSSLKLYSKVFFDKTFGGVNIFSDANYTVLSTLFLHSLDLRYKPDHRYINVKIF